ncbi:MAG TPA: RHS repeat-associated core domain-containing protein, partial [Mycobacterium sp.]|nr:RHS repeat-associated core domain-containing protein [Mycobacterium sp.]
NRYYNPATGQFVSVDPDVAGTGEPYGYAGGDPVDNTDPDGLCMRTTAAASCNYNPTTGKSTGMGKPDPPRPYQAEPTPATPAGKAAPAITHRPKNAPRPRPARPSRKKLPSERQKRRSPLPSAVLLTIALP